MPASRSAAPDQRAGEKCGLGDPQRYTPSYFACAGWGWYRFEFDNRAKAHAEGPYIGCGLQFCLREDIKVTAGYMRSFYTSEVEPTVPGDHSGQFSIGLTGSWYF